MFLEPMADFAVIAKAMRDGQRLAGASVYLPSKSHKKKLLEATRKLNLNCEGDILSYSTIDHEYDDELYTVAMELAGTLVGIIRSCSLAIFGNRNYFIREQNTKAAEVYFHDQFVGAIRKYIDFGKRVEETNADEIIYVPRPGPHWNNNLLYLQRTYPELNIKVFKNHWLPGHISRYSPKTLSRPESSINRLARRSTLDGGDVLSGPNIFFCTNLIASQFRDSVIPLFEKILTETNVLCYNFAAPVEDSVLNALEERFKASPFDLKVYQRSVKTKPKDIDSREAKFLHIIVKRFCENLSKRNDRYAKFDIVVRTMLYTRILPFLLDLKSQHKALTKILKHTNLVVVVPGRSSDALLSVAIAEDKAIPSIEIQSGVISKFKRFVKPQTDEVIALEPYGSSVYTEFLGFPSEKVEVLGFVKLELDTEPYRKMSQVRVKEELAEHGVEKDLQTIVLATQPIGVDHAKEVAKVALGGVKSLKNVQLIIKPHPSEDEAYFYAYHQVAKQLGVENYKILTNYSIMPLIVAGDIVLTYFSTVGLEAFALNKPVICINPFQTRPPVDLVELGIALEAKSGDSLTPLLEDYLSDNVEISLHDPLLDRLRDGMGIRRIQEHLIDRAFSHLHR